MKVLAGQDLRQGAFTSDLPIDAMSNAKITHALIIMEGSNGKLTCGQDELLVQNIKWSDDIQGCNTILERSTAKSLKLHLTKTVRKGDEITMWFSQEILAAMDVPFLNPINILGEKNYTCHRCGRSFEYPNPLKVHLSLNCGVLKKKELWKRLKTSLALHPSQSEFIFKLRNRQENLKPSSPLSYSSPSPERCRPENRPSSEPPQNSAFKPYNMNEFKEIQDKPYRVPDYLSKEHYLNRQAAEIETLVSNLGHSKQGHLCLYCGKIYSRKYGLKIHIRTHTGFKPLKCKYCLRPFGDPSNLNKHVRLHSETDTPYRCTLCSKMLVRRRDLERHLKSRHNIEDF